MTISPPPWIALDIGGANIKAAHTSGIARTVPFELWKRPDELPRLLSQLTAALPPAERIAITMTAELCDCYPTKAKGVREVLTAAKSVYSGKLIRVWGTDGRFHTVEDILEHPDPAAASNWLALASVAARLLPDRCGLLVDVGSTTTDLIPLRDGKPVPRGRTDTQRLRSGELVYIGVRRTPVCALATELKLRDATTGLSAELFASTLDVYLVRRQIPPDPYNASTADGRPATVEAASDRLARMVGADRDTFSLDDASTFADAAHAALMGRMLTAAERACRETIGQPQGAVIAGSGEFLARELAHRLLESGCPIVSLNEAWGPIASSAGCATALGILASERDGELAIGTAS
jgi:probable H4MPT-linked C1 transfer pathway protein